MATRPLFTATFWLDTLERAVKTIAQTVLGVVGTNVADVTSLDWGELGILAGATGALSILMSIVSSGIGEPGTASVLNPAPPDTLKDRGLGVLETICLVVLVVFAIYGLTVLF